MSHDNPHACHWCRQHPCEGKAGNGSCRGKPAAPEMPEGWTPLTAGLTNGRLLLVMAEKELAVVSQKEFAAGVRISKVPLSVLRALLSTQGLSICTEAEAACAKHGLAWLQSTPDTLGKNEGMMVLALRRYEAELARRGQP